MDEQPPITWAFRRRTLICSQALLRLLRKAVGLYGDDIDSFIIYLAVTCASVEGALRDTRLAADSPPGGPMPLRHYRGISRRAIAASTGLPRETVRRKIAAFVEGGKLVSEGDGVRIPQGLLEDSRHFEFAQALVLEFGRTGARLEQVEEAPL